MMDHSASLVEQKSFSRVLGRRCLMRLKWNRSRKVFTKILDLAATTIDWENARAPGSFAAADHPLVPAAFRLEALLPDET